MEISVNALPKEINGDTCEPSLTYRAAMEMDNAFKKAMKRAGFKESQPIKNESAMSDYRPFFNAQRFSMMGSSSQMCSETTGAESGMINNKGGSFRGAV